MDHDAFGSVLRLTHRDQLALPQPPGLDRLQRGPALHDHAVHARPGRRDPAAAHVDVGGQVGGGEEAFGQHAVGRERLEARLRPAGERRLAEVRQCVGTWEHTRVEGRGTVGGFQGRAPFPIRVNIHATRGEVHASARDPVCRRRPRLPRGRRGPGAHDPRHHRPGHHPRHPAARAQRYRHPHPGAARAGAVRGGRAGPRRPRAGPAHPRHRRGAQQPARRRGRQPLQLLARPADLHPRLRQPVQLRGARTQDPGGRHPPDAARRTEPAHQRGLRRPRAGRGAAGLELLALRQRVGRSDRLPDRARGARPVRPAGAAARRRRQAGRRRLLQVAELDLGPVRRRERHAVGLAVQGRRLPPAQRGRVPAAQRRRRVDRERLDRRHGAAQPGGQSRGAEPRRAHPERVPGQPRLRRREQHPPRRRQGRAAVPARASG